MSSTHKLKMKIRITKQCMNQHTSKMRRCSQLILGPTSTRGSSSARSSRRGALCLPRKVLPSLLSDSNRTSGIWRLKFLLDGAMHLILAALASAFASSIKMHLRVESSSSRVHLYCTSGFTCSISALKYCIIVDLQQQCLLSPLTLIFTNMTDYHSRPPATSASCKNSHANCALLFFSKLHFIAVTRV